MRIDDFTARITPLLVGGSGIIRGIIIQKRNNEYLHTSKMFVIIIQNGKFISNRAN